MLQDMVNEIVEDIESKTRDLIVGEYEQICRDIQDDDGRDEYYRFGLICKKLQTQKIARLLNIYLPEVD